MDIRVGGEILLVASCYRNRDKRRPDGPLGSYTDFTYKGQKLSLNKHSNIFSLKKKLFRERGFKLLNVSITQGGLVRLKAPVFTNAIFFTMCVRWSAFRLSVENQNQSSHNGQSEQQKLSEGANDNSK